MRGLRSTGLLLVAFIVIGGYAYFIESDRPPASEADDREQLFEIDGDDIRSLVVTADNGEMTTVRRDEDDAATWTMTAPVATAGDGNAAAAIASSLASLEVQRVVEEDAADLSPYGLSDPRVAVEFEDRDGFGDTLLVGDETPTGSDRYATLASSPRVFLISGFLESTFNRTTFDLRDRSLLGLSGTEVAALAIDHDGDTIRFESADGEWRLVAPLAARADFGLVEGIVGRIRSAEMVAIARDAEDGPGPDELAGFGLDRPRMTVRVETTGDGDDQTLLLGDETDGGTVYGRDASRDIVFTADAALFDDLARDATVYREKDLFDFRPFNAEALTVTYDGETLELEQATDGEADGTAAWRRLQPAPGEVDDTVVTGLLSSLSGLRAESFVDGRTATAAAVATVTVRFDGGREERVTLGRSDDGGRTAGRDDEPGTAVVETAAVDAVLEAIETVTATTESP